MRTLLKLSLASLFFTSISFADGVASSNNPSVGYPVKPMGMAFDNSRQALHLCLSADTGFAHVDVDHPDAHLMDINSKLSNTQTQWKAYLELKALKHKQAPGFGYLDNKELDEMIKGFCACEKLKGVDLQKLKVAKASLFNQADIKAQTNRQEAYPLDADLLKCK